MYGASPIIILASDVAQYMLTITLSFILALKRLAFDYTILEFAQEPGYLSLTHSSREKLNITVMRVYIGRYSGRYIVTYVVDYSYYLLYVNQILVNSKFCKHPYFL